MELHNQTPNRLHWEMGGEAYDCEPWGAVDVPDRFVELCKSRTLPLGPAPVAPDNRAAIKARRAQDMARRDEVLKLRNEADSARADAECARAELEKTKHALTIAHNDVTRALADIAKLTAELKATSEERAALEKQLNGLASKVAEFERRTQQKKRSG